jgi:type III pantothenate kinase
MVFLTGGDSEWLANSLDDTIVTNKNLVLIGLNRILDEN